MSKKTIKIAITGGVGSGKSQVLSYLKGLGYPVFSCDEINAALFSEREYVRRIRALFPDVVKNEKIDKRALSEKVFSSESDRKTLEGLAHPLILQKLTANMDACEGVCFAEVPLLFEANLQKHFQKVIVVMRKKEARLSAVAVRDACDESVVLQKMSAQFPYDEVFGNGACLSPNIHLIFNDGSFEFLHKQMDDFLKTLM